ncbi:hypothetical protein GCM10009657_32780 [Oryzihumus leptocrescens]
MGVLPYRLDGVTRTAVRRPRLCLPPLGLIVCLRDLPDRDVCPGRPGATERQVAGPDVTDSQARAVVARPGTDVASNEGPHTDLVGPPSHLGRAP